ncbi:MAG: hypothetical protein U0270_01930 [Labilithrix sp.]
MIELVAIGATESPKALQPGGFGAIAADAVGRRAITYGRSESLVWDLSTGQRLASGGWLRLHPDGRRGLRADSDGSVVVADLETAETLTRLDGVKTAALPALGPGEHFADAIRADAPPDRPPAALTHVWALASGKRVHTIEEPSVLAAYLPEGRLLLVGARGGSSVWDLASAERISLIRATAKRGERPIKLRVSQDGRTAVTVGSKGTTSVWDLEKAELVASSDAMTRELGGGARDHFELLADGRHAVVASRPGAYGDQFIGVMDLASGELDLSWTTTDEEREISQLAVFPDAPEVAIVIARRASAPAVLEVWDASDRTMLAATDAPLAKGLVVTAGRRVVITGGGAWGGAHFFRVYRA